jgi:hypothetical protein
MDYRPAKTITRQQFTSFNESNREDNITDQRLNVLLELNAKTAREKMLYKSDREKQEAGFMRRPLDTSKAFSYFGLMLGTLPPAAIFAKFLSETFTRNGEAWIIGFILIMNIITAIVGYFSGKLIGKIVKESETYSWQTMILLTPFVGILWGIMAGGAGGAIVFLIGALFGAAFGAMVGGAAIPVFTIFHRLLKKGEMIELKHFLPLAFGITFTICAFILGI